MPTWEQRIMREGCAHAQAMSLRAVGVFPSTWNCRFEIQACLGFLHRLSILRCGAGMLTPPQ